MKITIDIKDPEFLRQVDIAIQQRLEKVISDRLNGSELGAVADSIIMKKIERLYTDGQLRDVVQRRLEAKAEWFADAMTRQGREEYQKQLVLAVTAAAGEAVNQVKKSLVAG